MIDIDSKLKTATIQIDNEQEYTIKILDDKGSVLETIMLKQNQFVINYSKFGAGNYSLKLESDQSTVLKNFQI